MSTTQQTTGSNVSNLQFNPIAQGIYNQLIQGGGDVLKGYISSPFSNAAYTMGAAQSQAGAQAGGANLMKALNQAQLTGGLGGQAGAGWLAAQRAQTGRAGQAMSSQANISNVLAALQRQMMATGTGMSFAPQLTGQTGQFTQTQKTGGLGTWLPQLMSGGLSAAMAMGGGGTGSFGSVGGMADPALGNISYMPGGGGMAGVPMGPGGFGTVPGLAPAPFPYQAIFGGQ